MKDLRISYTNENDEVIEPKYTTLMEFLDLMESDNVDIPMLDKAKREDIYIYDTEGHYTWHGSLREALENIQESITRKE